MTGTSRVEGCLIREHVEWAVLARALSEVLAVDLDGIRTLDMDHPMPPVPIVVECHEHASGFRLDVTLYLDARIQPALSGIPLARRLAMTLGQEVLTSPPAERDGSVPPPDLWVLALPDGALFLVRQLDPESEDVEFDRDPRHMHRLPHPSGHAPGA